MNSKVSFTIRPPTLSSTPATHQENRRSANSYATSFTSQPIDSSDEDDEDGAIEPVTGFDRSGAQRLHEKPKPSGPLIIPALANRDWRAIARVRQRQSFIPDGVTAQTGTDGSQGGLGTRDIINSGPRPTGLVIRPKKESESDVEGENVKFETQESRTMTVELSEENEDERARLALLASVDETEDDGGITIDAIPISNNNYFSPADETDAYKRDVITRPDSATLADYERVPVSQFGAALLRGMGWTEGTAASRTRPGLVEPWLPTSRPALLGIGAKERPAEDVPPTKGGYVNKRPEKRYLPVVKVRREGSEVPPPSRSRSRSPSRSTPGSKVPSFKSASPYPTDRESDWSARRRDRRDRDRVYDSDHSRCRRDGKGRDKERDFNHDRRRERSDKNRDQDRRHDEERSNRTRIEKGDTHERARYLPDREERY